MFMQFFIAFICVYCIHFASYNHLKLESSKSLFYESFHTQFHFVLNFFLSFKH